MLFNIGYKFYSTFIDNDYYYYYYYLNFKGRLIIHIIINQNSKIWLIEVFSIEDGVVELNAELIQKQLKDNGNHKLRIKAFIWTPFSFS